MSGNKNSFNKENLRELVRTPHLVQQALRDYEKLSDEKVIEQFQSGDLVSFDVLVARYKEQLTNFVFNFVGFEKYTTVITFFHIKFP